MKTLIILFLVCISLVTCLYAQNTASSREFTDINFEATPMGAGREFSGVDFQATSLGMGREFTGIDFKATSIGAGIVFDRVDFKAISTSSSKETQKPSNLQKK